MPGAADATCQLWYDKVQVEERGFQTVWDPETTLRYEHDLVPFKPEGDVIVLGFASVAALVSVSVLRGDLAHKREKCEPQWPYDQRLVDEAAGVLQTVISNLEQIRDVADQGIRTLMEGHRWGGAAFHNAGWNPRHIEGAEHFLFYNLEYRTGKHFIHGQPVCLGIYIISALQNNHAEEMLDAIERVGVPIRPRDMHLAWEDVAGSLRTLRQYVEKAGLWYTVVNDRPITEEFIERVRQRLSQPPKYEV